MNLEEKIRDVPDFPKKGIVFKDVIRKLRLSSLQKQEVSFLALPWHTIWVLPLFQCESH